MPKNLGAMRFMEERTKYVIIGILIGIVIGIGLFYLLMSFRVIGPSGGREFARPDNLTDFTRNFSRGVV